MKQASDPPLAALGQALEDLRSGGGHEALAKADDAYRRAITEALAPDPEMDSLGTRATIAETIAYNLATLRRQADWTQRQVAEAMASTGLPRWVPQKVAEVETARRGLRLDELFVIAAMYGVPVIELFWPGDHDDVEINGTDYPALLLRELIIGRDGRPGHGGPDWTPAAIVCGTADRRPATDAWRARTESQIGGTER